MKIEERFSAKQVAGIAVGTSLWVCLSITMTLFPWPDPFMPHRHVNVFWMTVYVTWTLSCLAAIYVMYQAIRAFQDGISQEVWKQEDITELRGYFAHKAVNVVIWMFAAGALGYLLFDIIAINSGTGHHHNSIGGFAYFWISPSTTLAALRQALKPARPREIRLWREQMKPVSSDHWGERGAVLVGLRRSRGWWSGS